MEKMGRRNPPLPTTTQETCLRLRKDAAEAKLELWFHLRAHRLNGWKFRRQHPVPPYFVDFYCSEANLAIELDGSQHNGMVDSARTAFLEARGIKILRFWDNDVLLNTNAVLESILNTLGNRTLSPTPLPEGEGLQDEAIMHVQEHE